LSVRPLGRGSVVGELVEEGAGGVDRELVGEREQVLVAGDEDGTFAFGEGEQVIVARVGRAARRIGWVGCVDGPVAEQADELGCFLCAHTLAQRRSLELGEKGLGDNEPRTRRRPAADQLRRRPGRGEQGRDEDVRIEDGAHSAPSPMRRVLRLDGELERLLLVEVVALQEPVERVEAELAPQRLLDQLAVALAGARADRRPGAAARAGSGSSAASVRG
jgi:hypothetical protein